MIAEVSLGQILFALVFIVVFNNVTMLMLIYGNHIFKTKG